MKCILCRCNNTWNTEYCVEMRCDPETSVIPCNMSRSPAKEFFKLVTNKSLAI